MRKLLRNGTFVLSLCIALSMFLSACGSGGREEGAKAAKEANPPQTQLDSSGEQKKPEFIKSESDSQITILDPLGNEVTIDKKPQRVAILMNSILDLWYMAGGKAIARVDGTENVPPEAESVESLGSLGSPNIEKIVALKPDLVIMTSTMAAQCEMKDILEQNKIKYLYVNYRVYQDFIDYLDLFTRLNGREDIFKGAIAEMKASVAETAGKVSGQKPPKVLILFATTKSVTCELPTGLTGDMASILGADNIVSDSPVKEDTKVEFSMERIVERDPDIILITTMGDAEKAKARVKEDIETNQAWAGLRAVKEGNVVYLPKELYIYKPNARYPEAVENLAKILYPGVYK